MNIIYILLIIVLSVIINASISFLMPSVRVQLRLLYTYIKRVLTRKPKPTIDPTTLIALIQRIEELEQQYKQRQINFKSRVREEVRDYLEHLKTK